MQRKFEYKIIESEVNEDSLSDENQFNDAGQEGYRLVSQTKWDSMVQYIFEREVIINE